MRKHGDDSSWARTARTRAANRCRAVRVLSTLAALWLVPVIAASRGTGPDNVFSPSRCLLQQDGDRHASAAPTPCSPMSLRRRSRTIVAPSRRDAGRPRHGGDDARAADHGVQFVGFMAAIASPAPSAMLAGTLGGLLVTWVTFTPCFLWMFLGAPFIEVLRGTRHWARPCPPSPHPWSA